MARSGYGMALPGIRDLIVSGHRRFLDLLNPKYHVHRAIEDVRMMRHAFKTRSTLGKTAHDYESLQQLFRGKLFSCFFMSGPSGILAAVMAYGVQRFFKSPWMGLLATFLFAFVVTTIAYQMIWFADNRVLYRRKRGFQKLFALERDLWPIHFVGVRTGLIFLFLVTPINGVIIGAIEFASKQFAEWFPVPVIAFLVDVAVVQGPFLRIMGDAFERHSHVLAERYLPLFGADGLNEH